MNLEKMKNLMTKAATSKSTMIIHYVNMKKQKSYREVEPYKLERLEGKDDYIFWGWDIKDNLIKKFYGSRLSMAFVSGRKYNPRWDIEIDGKVIRTTGESISD